MENATKEPTQFGSLASRIANCTERVAVVADQVKICVDSLDGSEPQDETDKVSSTGEDGSILTNLSCLVSQLEHRLLNLEREQARLSKLF